LSLGNATKEECKSLWLGEDKVLNNKLKSIERYAITTSACWIWLETSASSKVMMGIESSDDVRAILISAFFGPGFRTAGSSDVDWKF